MMVDSGVSQAGIGLFRITAARHAAFVLMVLVSCRVAGAQEDGWKDGGSVVPWGTCGFGSCAPPSPNTGYTALSAGAGQILALTSEGRIATSCPPPSHIRCDVPEPNADFIGLAAGWFHGLGLRNDGSIVAWGHNNYGQRDVALPNEGYVAVSANRFQSLGLRSDGTVSVWGCGNEVPELCTLPAPNHDFISISAGLYHNLGLRSDGSVVAWGCVEGQQFEQCNIPEPNSDFVAVSAGYYHSLGLKSDGSIVFWGYCELSSDLDGSCELPDSNEGFVAISAGGWHSLALRENGSIAAWGQNGSRQCNVPYPNYGYRLIAAGGNNSFALAGDCNGNAVADNREIFETDAFDCDGNWILEECEIRPVTLADESVLMNRYVGIVAGSPGRRTAIRVRLVSLGHSDGMDELAFPQFEGQVRWVGPPAQYEDAAAPDGRFTAAALQCAPFFHEWDDAEVVHVFGSEIIPGSRYELQVIPEECSLVVEGHYTAGTEARTARWGDVAWPFWGGEAIQPDVVDISALVDKYSDAPDTLLKAAAQLQPRVPDPASLVSFLDIALVINAFRGSAFPAELGPMPCP